MSGAVDLTALVLSADGKVSGDADMIFFNQPEGPGLALAGTQLTVDFARLRAGADKVVLVASPEDESKSFGQISAPDLTVTAGGQAVATFTPAGLSAETALILVEIYSRNGDWKVRAVGQGYASGLAGVATDFGIDVGDDPAPAPSSPPAASPPPAAPSSPPAPSGAPISLEKQRMVNLEKKLTTSNPEMLSLVKKAGVSLEKKGLSEHTARVALCLDISSSMMGLFMGGAVQRLVERVLALGLRFDDDGEVDVFLFGRNGHQPPGLSLANIDNWSTNMLQQFPLEGGTHYAKALKLVREHYFGGSGKRLKAYQDQLPVYLMFITDGVTMDRQETEDQVRWASHEPMFIQFMGIGEDEVPEPTPDAAPKKRGLFGGGSGNSGGDSRAAARRAALLQFTGFGFLHELDDLKGRLVDNADFFAITPDQLLGFEPISDDALFDLMMTEYPGWIPQAREKGLLT